MAHPGLESAIENENEDEDEEEDENDFGTLLGADRNGAEKACARSRENA